MGNQIDIDRKKLHPWLDYKLGLLLKECEKQKCYIIVTCGYRSAAEQNKLYAQGRTTNGSIITNARGLHTQHAWGIALDIAMNYDVDKDGKVSDDTWNMAGFKKVAKIAKKLGFAWGGDWTSIVDAPHIYLPKWGSTPTTLINKYGTFENFKKTWTGTVKCGTKIRKKKLFSSETKKFIMAGTTVEILWKSKLGYAKIRYGSTVGYIRKGNLK